jgi:NAD(P)-dependent dehydrogenase (short-subunit alcohol dehydrogenase family)
VTGAAGGITSAIGADLAAASGGTFHLVDLAPLPAADDPHVALLRRDRERLKLALIAEAKARGDKPLPPAIEKQILDVERQEAARRAVEAVEAAAGTAVYHSVNLLDGAAVARVVDAVRERHGRIDALIHAGGIEVSHDLPQKDAAEFARVFDIKADGFFSLLKAAASLPIGASLVFSSVAGRFGNAGQTDYAAANALLCALTSHLRGLRPELRAVAVDWTAWAGIGMATRGSIPKIMEAAGIEMLPPEVGIPSVRRELTAGGGSGEVVVAGRLGVMGAEWEAAGGLDRERANAALVARPQPLLMVGRLLGAQLYGGLEAETTLDPRQQPFLYDHALDGTPILPGVMATEAFAEIASVLVPDLTLVSVEDVVFDKPFKFYRNEPASFRLAARAGTMHDGEIVVETRLYSLIQPRPEVPAVAKTHFQARVRLARKAPRKLRVAFKKPAPRSLDIGQQAIYSVYFHGPAYRVVERAAVDGNVAIGLLARGLPPHTAPPTAAELVQPRLVELCFQTAGLWEITRERRLALPSALRAVRLLRASGPASRRRLWAVAERQPDGSFTTRVVDDSGEVLLELVGYTTVTLEEGRSLPT